MWDWITRKLDNPILIKLVKIWEDYDEDSIVDRLEIIMAVRKEKAEKEREEKIQAQA